MYGFVKRNRGAKIRRGINWQETPSNMGFKTWTRKQSRCLVWRDRRVLQSYCWNLVTWASSSLAAQRWIDTFIKIGKQRICTYPITPITCIVTIRLGSELIHHGYVSPSGVEMCRIAVGFLFGCQLARQPIVQKKPNIKSAPDTVRKDSKFGYAFYDGEGSLKIRWGYLYGLMDGGWYRENTKCRSRFGGLVGVF